MSLEIRIAVRDWDYLTPLVLGDVTSRKLHLRVDRVENLVADVGTDPVYDAAELSFSRYASRMADDDRTIVGTPNFLMRGFRHRCIITRQGSPLRDLRELAGKRIGVPGWRDSGHTWTRAALRRMGVGIDDAYWFTGRLLDADPKSDKLGSFGRPGRIEAVADDRSLMELLGLGLLDAVFAPFVPPEFYAPDRRFRPVVADLRAAELTYFHEVGYVPGIHLLAFKASVVAENPWIMREISDLLDESQSVWLAKRRKYVETAPWIIETLIEDTQDLPETWNRSGLEANERMVEDFGKELHVQGILPVQLSPDALFPGVSLYA